METYHTFHYDVESVTSKRYSIGEVLAAMKPEEDDNTGDLGPPLDFSFKELRKMADISRTKPRDGVHAYVIVPVSLTDDENLSSVTPSSEKKDVNADEEFLKEPVKYCSKAIRLSNNSISKFDGFSRAIQSVIEMPDYIEWIDLSFNDLKEISDALLKYKNLKVLYLHANYIDDITQVDKLASLPLLKTLTLHGNIMDEMKGYRQYIITAIPQLQYLDFSRVTRADRDKAVTWRKLKVIGHQKKKKKKAKE